ncbi:PucR family transcriptional regulator [Saccharopolyspora pogona]|uniref:PucR family transcriptional regulator n=1 Tax=Saccharopolyspora pogona TaxID=333966 RepID=UPI001683D2F8|nr:PucR family transcriptional regulator [Saccharopolyspora pogona]
MLRIRDLLEYPDLGLRTVGGTGNLDTVIRWVHVAELPDPRPYLRDDELILTNGLWVPHQPADDYIRCLVDAHASGLVFGLRTAMPEIPHALVRACRMAQLPLLQLPIDIPFSAVTEAVATVQAQRQQRRLVETLRRNRALTRAVSAGRGLCGVLNVLSGPEHVPVALVDRLGSAVHEVHWSLPEEDLRVVADKLSRGCHEDALTLSDGTEATLIPIQGVGGPDHALLYGRACGHSEQAERDALEQAVQLITAELLHEQAINAIQMQFAGEILDMVLRGWHRSEELVSRLRSFGIDPQGPLGVFALSVSGEASKALTPLPETVLRFFVKKGLPSVVPSSEQDLVAVVGLHDGREDLRPLVEELVDVLENSPYVQRKRITAGVGQVARGHQDLRRSLLQAREAAKAARVRQGQPVVSFTDVGSHRLMLALLDSRTRRDFAEAVLGPVIDYDRTHNSELFRTLVAFFRSERKWGETASKMHVHVNTLRNRIAKLHQLTGRDPAQTENLVDLFIAVQVYSEPD